MCVHSAHNQCVKLDPNLLDFIRNAQPIHDRILSGSTQRAREGIAGGISGFLVVRKGSRGHEGKYTMEKSWGEMKTMRVNSFQDCLDAI